MSALEEIRDQILSSLAPSAWENGVLVPTPVLYPSNSNVVVYVTGGAKSCVVSDRGDALRVARAHGAEISDADQWLRNVLRGSFLHSSSGDITSGEMEVKNVLAGIALVARAAATAVSYAIEHYVPRKEITIQQRALTELKRRFGPSQISRSVSARGASDRHYSFDFSIVSIGPKPLLLDTVSPNPNSINAKAVAHIDLENLQEKAPMHAIIYDQSADWDAAEINLLQSAAQLLPVSRLSQELNRYAHIN